MKNDRPKYMPDVAKVLRENEPTAFAERERNALAKLREEGIIERFTPAPGARVSAPSPWAKEGAGAEIDKTELPSAMAPVATGAEEQPVTKAAASELAKAWKPSWKVVAGLASFVVTVALVSVIVLVGQMRDAARKAPAMPSATATEEVVPNAMAIPRPVATAAEPDAGAVPSPVPSSPRPRLVHPPTIAPPVATDILP